MSNYESDFDISTDIVIFLILFIKPDLSKVELPECHSSNPKFLTIGGLSEVKNNNENEDPVITSSEENCGGIIRARDDLGPIKLLVTFEDEHWCASHQTRILVIDAPSYNGIICRPTLNALKTVVSTPHRAMKLPFSGHIITLK
ncbi:hypothetical protein RIF29_33486 [Crotalaria pallida]|uniref:Uncharacterized protein n=1 Tax=Crotalaria pallida TaxID=3830 RepID=A0AAN9E861_CROPI